MADPNITDWIEAGAAVVTALASTGTLLLVLIYTIETISIRRSTSASITEGIRPRVVLSTLNEVEEGYKKLLVKNSGRGPAVGTNWFIRSGVPGFMELGDGMIISGVTPSNFVGGTDLGTLEVDQSKEILLPLLEEGEFYGLGVQYFNLQGERYRTEAVFLHFAKGIAFFDSDWGPKQSMETKDLADRVIYMIEQVKKISDKFET